MVETGIDGRKTVGRRAHALGGLLRSSGSRFFAPGSMLWSERDRWFLWVPVLVGSGVGFYFALPFEPPLYLGIVAVIAATWARHVLRDGVYALLGTAVVLSVCCGFVSAQIRTALVASPVLTERLFNIDVEGVIVRVEPRAKGGRRLTIRPHRIGRLAPGLLPRHIRIVTRTKVDGISAGKSIFVRATLSPPPRPVLPGGYDFARSAFFSGLGGVGYAHGTVKIMPAEASGDIIQAISAALQRLREDIARRVSAALPGQTGAIAVALITGERGAISEEINQAYRASGLTHILSISGLHMTIMAGFVFFSVRFGLSLFPSVLLRFPVKKWAALLAAHAALGYLMISGGSYATVRAWIMISVMFLAVLLDRPAIALRNVAIAGLAILILVPESLFDIGFQMSFAAVTALVATYEAFRDRRRLDETREARRSSGAMGLALVFGGIVLTTAIASVAVAPFAAYHFHTSQQFAVLANLIAVPICNFVVMPMALLALLLLPVGFEAWPLLLMGIGIDGMTWCANTVAALPGAVLRIPTISFAGFLVTVAGGIWLCLWRRTWRLAGVPIALTGIVLMPMVERPDVLIGRGGDLVAFRGADGRLQAVGTRRGRYELGRWLEADGDVRTVSSVFNRRGAVCDRTACRFEVKGRTVAVVRHPAAFRDACRRADILIANFSLPHGCGGSGLRIDRDSLRRSGNQAIYLTSDGLKVVTVEALRGNRPWARGADQ